MINSIIFDFYNVLVFSDYQKFERNNSLLEYLQKLKSKYNLYLFTAGTLYQKPEFIKIIEKTFLKVFTESDIGFLKSDPRSYLALSERINTPVSEILFVDDKIENVSAATNAGLSAIQYISNDQLLKDTDMKI